MPKPPAKQLLVVGDFVKWPDPKSGPWVVRLRWAYLNGRPECVGMDVWFSVEPDLADTDGVSFRPLPRQATRPITATELRGAQFGTLVAEQRKELGRRGKKWRERLSASDVADGFSPEAQSWLKEVANATATAEAPLPTSPGRRGRKPAKDPAFFVGVAEVYTDAGGSTKAVQQHYDVTYALAAKWVHHARKDLRLLPETRRGVAAPGLGSITKESKR